MEAGVARGGRGEGELWVYRPKRDLDHAEHGDDGARIEHEQLRGTWHECLLHVMLGIDTMKCCAASAASGTGGQEHQHSEESWVNETTARLCQRPAPDLSLILVPETKEIAAMLNTVDESDAALIRQAPAVPFGHAPVCPVREAMKRAAHGEFTWPPPVDTSLKRPQQLLIAVVVLIESTEADGYILDLEPTTHFICEGSHRVLLTRRRDDAVIFPSFWVLPGGHAEKGENLVQVGIREVQEETGVKVEEKDMSLCGLWESVYPQRVEYGLPQKHHLVPFFSAKLSTSADETPLLLQEEEVAAACWLDRETVIKWIELEERKERVLQRRKLGVEESVLGDKVIDTLLEELASERSGDADRVEEDDGKQDDKEGDKDREGSGRGVKRTRTERFSIEERAVPSLKFADKLERAEASSDSADSERMQQHRYDMLREWLALGHRFVLKHWAGQQ